MGNIGFPELLVILVVAFLFIGPKRMPALARALGEAIRAFRQALPRSLGEHEDGALESSHGDPELTSAEIPHARPKGGALQPGEGDREYTPKLPAEDAPQSSREFAERSTPDQPHG